MARSSATTVGFLGGAAAGQRLAPKGFRFGPPVQRFVSKGQLAAVEESDVVRRAQLRFAGRNRALQQRDRLVQPAGLQVRGCEVAHADDPHVSAERERLQLGKRRLVEREAGRPAGFRVHIGQVEAADEGVGVVVAEIGRASSVFANAIASSRRPRAE